MTYSRRELFGLFTGAVSLPLVGATPVRAWATGGVVKGITPYRFGERAPEMIIPRRVSTRSSLDALMAEPGDHAVVMNWPGR